MARHRPYGRSNSPRKSDSLQIFEKTPKVTTLSSDILSMGNILIIDDERDVNKTLATLIARMGHTSAWKSTLGEGLQALQENRFDVVLLDVHLPDGCGLDRVRDVREAPGEPEVIILTGHGTVDGAEIAINSGAWDYLQKSDTTQGVNLTLKRAMEYRKEKAQQRREPVALKLDGIVGDSQPMKSCYDHLARAASCEANVLLFGETGTGKEIFARAVHANSRRSAASLVVVDGAALPQKLGESLLFGHEKGVYTGADKTREGLIAQADGGTLFLDEVGELSPEIQKVFLRVLQERKYRPVGGRRELPSNFRLVAATNRDLEAMVAQGTFRKDLLYRLRTIHITLPPLRDRNGDIKRLVSHYLSAIGERSGTGCKGIAPDFMETITAYDWPGNVRELLNALETAVANATPEATLYARHLPQDIRLRVIQCSLENRDRPFAVEAATRLNGSKPMSLTTFKTFRKAAVFQAEKRYLQALLEQSGKNLDKSLGISGLSRSRFYDLLKQHNLSL